MQLMIKPDEVSLGETSVYSGIKTIATHTVNRTSFSSRSTVPLLISQPCFCNTDVFLCHKC